MMLHCPFFSAPLPLVKLQWKTGSVNEFQCAGHVPFHTLREVQNHH
jgi:hypothetical protein